jgi:hypothetical protein
MKKSGGRPKKTDGEKLTQVNFKADAETLASLAKIVAARQPGDLDGEGGRSRAIRRAIAECAARL